MQSVQNLTAFLNAAKTQPTSNVIWQSCQSIDTLFPLNVEVFSPDEILKFMPPAELFYV